MPETRNEKKIYRLEEIAVSLERMIRQFYGGKFFWIRAEISELRIAPSGHAYLNLVDANEEVVKAEMRGVIWKTALDGIHKELGDEFAPLMKAGSEIVFRAGVQYNKCYGLSLTILQVDLGTVLGDLEKRKQKTLRRLRRDGLLQTNKQHTLPLVIQRIALIGAPDSAGFQDFMQQLQRNEWGFDFRVDVFPVTVQGDKARGEIIAALKKVDPKDHQVVALLRGGGSKLDLDVFNQESLALTLAHSPLPVLTGIGHETDISVADLVAHTYLKTPTALAYFLIDRAAQFCGMLEAVKKDLNSVTQQIRHRKASQLQNARGVLSQKPKSVLELQSMNLRTNIQLLARLGQQRVALAHGGLEKTRQLIGNESWHLLRVNAPRELDQLSDQLLHWAPLKIRQAGGELENLIYRLKALAPDQVLKHGYSMTRVNGQWLKRDTKMKVGDELLTETINKVITSTITKINERRVNL